MEVLVEYDYIAQNPDELTIKKGDRIRNVTRKEEGWFEGELNSNGKRGVFPDNFVKQIKIPNMPIKTMAMPYSSQNTIKSPDDKKKSFLNNTVIGFNGNNLNSNVKNQHSQPNSNSPTSAINSNNKLNQPPPPPKPVQNASLNENSFKARVLYSYIPVNDDELSIQENEIVEVLRLVEDGWYEGIYAGRQGVFPSNYVEKIVDENTNNISNESLNNNWSSENGNDSIDDKRKNKKVLGIGFGNIFSGKTIELKTKENFSNANSGSTKNANVIVNLNKANDPLQVQNQEITRKKIKAKVLFDYIPTQPDELKLAVGEIIYIIDKNLEDEGWWKGESITTGRIGVFPDNFVEEIIEPSNSAPNLLIAKRSNTNLSQNKQISTNNIHNSGNKPNITTTANDQIPISSSSSSSTSSSSSSSSAINSLSRQPDNKRQTNGFLNKNQNQSTDDIHSKSQSDISEDLDDIQSSDRNKLIHIKKTRQFNKRPPSFRNKVKELDNESNLNNSNERVLNGSNNFKDSSSSSAAQNIPNSKKENPSRQTTPISPKLSPSNTNELISNSVVSNITNASTASLIEEIGFLKQELDSVRKDSGQIHNDYKLVSGELNELRKNHDDQMKRMQKKLQDLISEIDEEKKTRLALQVELERLKKTIMNN